MKKISYIIAYLIIFINIDSCVGYKPIFDSTNIQFKIINHSIEGNKKLGNKIYTKLYNLSKSNKNNPKAKDVDIIIKVSKDKSSTAKNDAGKVIEYKINLNSQIIIKDYVTNLENLNQNFNSYASYKVQDQYSETLNTEKKAVNNLLQKITQEVFLAISQIIKK